MKMTKWQKFKKRLLIIFKEIPNTITNVLVPFVSVLGLILGLIPGMPTTVISFLKMLEDWLYNAAGTAKHIEEITGKHVVK